jgi:hypothetical protein
MDAKAINILYYALSIGEINKISSYKNVREGTNQVKESKINMLIYQYELFKIFPYESITNMFTRISIITNNLVAFGMIYINANIVSKFHISLPKTWKEKVMATQEAKDLTKL